MNVKGKRSLSLDARMPRGLTLWAPFEVCASPRNFWESCSALAECQHPYAPPSRGVTYKHSFWKQKEETIISFFSPCNDFLSSAHVLGLCRDSLLAFSLQGPFCMATHRTCPRVSLSSLETAMRSDS